MKVMTKINGIAVNILLIIYFNILNIPFTYYKNTNNTRKRRITTPLFLSYLDSFDISSKVYIGTNPASSIPLISLFVTSILKSVPNG